MRIPYTTILLTFILITTYFYTSSLSLYSSESDIVKLAFHISKNPLLILIHLFIHTGIYHLLGNLIPFIIFSIILEQKIGSKDTFAIFLFSGISSALLFSVLEPKYAIIGSSSAVAGIMSAAATRDPKKSFIALILTPLLIYYLFFPITSFFISQIHQKMIFEENKYKQTYIEAITQNKTQEAIKINKTITAISQERKKIEEGQEFERKTPTSISIHFFGALFGVIYFYILNRKEFNKGINEYVSLISKLNI